MIVVTDHSDYNHTENFIHGDTPNCGAGENQNTALGRGVDLADRDLQFSAVCRNYLVLWSGSSNTTIKISSFLQLARFSGYTRIRCPAA